MQAVPKSLLISIHPRFADLILKGEKRIEFRRSWAKCPVTRLVIYATSPVMRIVAVTPVTEVLHQSVNKLWEQAKIHGGGLTRRELRDYFNGSPMGYGVCLGEVRKFERPVAPSVLFERFHAPQSFRYLTELEAETLDHELAGGI